MKQWQYLFIEVNPDGTTFGIFMTHDDDTYVPFVGAIGKSLLEVAAIAGKEGWEMLGPMRHPCSPAFYSAAYSPTRETLIFKRVIYDTR